MSIQNISRSAPAPTMQGSAATGEVKALEQQKKQVQQEMEQVKQDKNLDKDSKDKKLEALQSKMKEIDNKIAQLKSTEKTGEETEVKEESGQKDMAAKDSFEKQKKEDQFDNTYKIEFRDGKKNIKFYRPKQK